ncbi:glucose 1-dehydrogenase [Hyphococcus sp. DH-69]|uniref:glucose 1-dehydrogenase n=1 Tax=Hyphococcus formosus TaxID=3143534 RepID=UPI00398AB58D
MSGRLNGKRAVVTGGARGIGAAIVSRFRDEGAEILLTDIDPAAAEAASHELKVPYFVQDISSEDDWRSTLDEARRRFSGLDILVNNAGLGDLSGKDSPETAQLDDWRRMFTINTEGVFIGCREAIPVMAESGGGSIINLSSIAALVPTPFLTAYGASKAAVMQMTKSIALHCAQNGYKIRCNTIHPGQIRTPMHDKLMEDTAKLAGAPFEAVRDDYLSRIPMGEFGDPADIANAALFLASDEARFITGSRLVVDGGMNLVN